MADLFEFESKIEGKLEGKKRTLTLGEKLVAPMVSLNPGTTAPELHMLERCLVKLGFMKGVGHQRAVGLQHRDGGAGLPDRVEPDL